MAGLNFERLKKDFDRDGFVVLRGYLSPEELAEMWDHLHRYHAEVEGPVKNGKPLPAIKGMNVHDDWYRSYLENGRQIPLMKSLIEDDLAPDNVTWLHKPKGVPRTMPHFDAIGSYRSPLSGIYSGISLWIALNRIDLNNGCLHYEKGSYKRDQPFGEFRLSPARLRRTEHPCRARRSRAGRCGHAYRADGALDLRSHRISRPQRHGVRLLGSEFGGRPDGGEKIQVRLCGRRHDALAVP